MSAADRESPEQLQWGAESPSLGRADSSAEPLRRERTAQPSASMWQLVILTACLAVLVVAALVVWWVPAMIDRWAEAVAAARVRSDEKLLTDAPEQLSYRAVARRVMPSVVNIRARFPGQSFYVADQEIGKLYRRELPGQAGQGSGVIVAWPSASTSSTSTNASSSTPTDVFVLTNHHVVTTVNTGRGPSRVVPPELLLVDIPGRAQPAEAVIVGLDPAADVALLALRGLTEAEQTRLRPAELGDSDAVEVGDRVLAFGSPFGLQHSVTDGIISAKGRVGVTTAERVEFLQTSAAINPGNSGGPLCDLAGRVIGINTAIVSRDGGSNGIGLAVPVNTIKTTLSNLLSHRPGSSEPTAPVSIRRGWLGVNIESLSRLLGELSAEQRLSIEWPTAGVVVLGVVDGSPAEKAGLRRGDIITELDGQPVSDAARFVADVTARPPGKVVKLTLWRRPMPTVLTVSLGEMPMLTPTVGEEDPPPSRH